MAATMEVSDGVKIATSTTARMKDGTVWKSPVKRMTMSSTQPPAWPATAPKVTPKARAAAVETAPTRRET